MKIILLLCALVFSLLSLVVYQTRSKIRKYDQFFIITGGPGAGKTTLISELEKRGYCCVEEAGRLIIQEELERGGDALPWANIARFKEKMLSHAIDTYERAINDCKGVTFFDRGVIDLIAYDRLTKTTHSEELQQAIKAMPCNKKVFIIPPWEEIYCNDAERKQTFDEAVEVYRHIAEVYSEYGFELIEVPKTDVESRVRFIVDHVIFE